MYLEYSGILDRARRHYFAKVIRDAVIGSEHKVLDYGCGTGDFLDICRAKGVSALGIDSSNRSVEIALSKGLNVVHGDLTALQGLAISFDLIFVQSVIEHVSDPLALLSGLRCHLNPNGLLVVSAPTPGPYFWDDPTHVRPHTPRSLEVLGELAGLRLIRISYVFAYLLGFNLRSSLVYRVMNLLPLSLGSNLIAFFRV